MPFPTPILDRALADLRQQNEQQRLATCDRVLTWLDAVGQEYGIDKAYLFGSLTRPYRFTKRSDGVRPALLSTESYDLLNGLRAFRHFFRHAYGVSLDFSQLQSNLNRAVQVKPLLDRDFDRFLEVLRSPN